jgi:hypothetical protein
MIDAWDRFELQYVSLLVMQEYSRRDCSSSWSGLYEWIFETILPYRRMFEFCGGLKGISLPYPSSENERS